MPYLKSAGAGALLVLGPLFLIVGMYGPSFLAGAIGFLMTVAALVHLIDPR